MKEDLGTFMKRRCAEWHKENPGKGLTAFELDRLMERWAGEFYNDGKQVEINTFSGEIYIK